MKKILSIFLFLCALSEASWVNPGSSGGGGSGITSINSQTGSSQTIASGTSGTDFAVSSSGDTHTLNLPSASASNRGVVTTGAQTIAGQKTFSSAPILSALTASGLVSLDGSKVATNPTVSAPITFSSNTLAVSAASTTASGVSEIATSAETTTGTDATRCVSPDGLAGSDYGKRLQQIKVIDDSTTLTTGDGKIIFAIDASLNGGFIVNLTIA